MPGEVVKTSWVAGPATVKVLLVPVVRPVAVALRVNDPGRSQGDFAAGEGGDAGDGGDGVGGAGQGAGAGVDGQGYRQGAGGDGVAAGVFDGDLRLGGEGGAARAAAPVMW